VIVAMAVLAGGFGALARAELCDAVARRVRPGWPWGTFVVNLLGSFLLGVVVGVLDVDGRAIAGTGFLGAFTVYATFALETVEQVERGDRLRAAAYVVASVLLGTLVAIAGIALTGAW